MHDELMRANGLYQSISDQRHRAHGRTLRGAAGDPRGDLAPARQPADLVLSYLRVLVPTITAVLCGVSFVLFLLRYDARLALILLLCLLLSGVAVPWLVRRLGDAPGRRTVTLKAELRAAAIDGVQGLAELQVYGAATAQAERIGALSHQLANEQERLSGLTGTALRA